ncbi:hypothetical protein E4U55_003994 [Claviceps digitariae]|nr:hypothetical protein E4U55_003994 [Claviceps digitariae]
MDELIAAAASSTTPSTLCQTFFLLAALALLSLHVILPSDARSIFLEYGARRHGNAAPDGNAKKHRGSSLGAFLLTRLAGLAKQYGQVPHSWFWHFYLLSTGLSVFWAWQFLGHGSVMAFLVEWQHQHQHQHQQRAGQEEGGRPSTELGRVYLAWGMMAAQGLRRLLECWWVSRPGKTPMLALHWVLALVYYTTMSVAVWVEGSGDILESWHSDKPAVLLTTRALLALAVFLAAWLKQNECHRHLASLKKYTLPNKGLFRYIVCPHYTCECVIYLAISVMAAPRGSFLDRPVLCGVVFVVINLGITASNTKQWYADKFGADKVADKWRMIPGIF